MTFLASIASAQSPIPTFPLDPQQHLERTCFQTGRAWSGNGNLRADVAIVYGIDETMPSRIDTWRDRGYRIHLMTGVSWGEYQDYLYGRFDGINHEDEAQTVADGRKSSHGGDVYYMCPGVNFGKFLSVGVQRALDAGVEAVHLEEPEFWVNSGYSEGFKREWQAYYDEPWQPPHGSVDAQWRASKLKYYLFRRALQQVFDHIQAYNRRTGRQVRCYVPTHSLINYASWEIVSPESSLARLDGCDGYIAQVWTGTARTPNVYRGIRKERTFETAFLEYGSMYNMVRATGRTVWFLNDPIEDNANHDWDDYQYNWESTLVASLLHPEVSQFEVAPWPERIFGKRYPASVPAAEREYIPPAYATELQTVMNTLNDMKQDQVSWDCGSTGIGLLIGDSLMFQRGDPVTSDDDMGHVYGLALPLLKRGMPVAPLQLENLTVPGYLDGFRVLMLTYQGMKPMSAEVHAPLADWVKKGGVLMVCDDDTDPYLSVREWWNQDGNHYLTPRQHLFEALGVDAAPPTNKAEAAIARTWAVNQGHLVWLHRNPAELASATDGDIEAVSIVKQAVGLAKLPWKETNYLVLRRGPYIICAGLDESVPGAPKILRGRFVNLFDSDLRVQKSIRLDPGSRYLLRDLDAAGCSPAPTVLASACKALPVGGEDVPPSWVVEGVPGTPGIVLVRVQAKPDTVTLDGEPVDLLEYDADNQLLWIRFENQAVPRTLTVSSRPTFTNPIVERGADPWVIQREGTYYLCQSRRGAIWVNRSDRLLGIGEEPWSEVWRPEPGQAWSRELWAPELHYLRQRWYIYVAADDGDNANHRMYVLEGTTQNPEDPFVLKGKLAAPTDRWAIDGTVLRLPDDQLYHIWSGWEGLDNVAQHLYIAPMSDPWTISGERVRISSPEYDWERNGFPLINEGPQTLWRGDRLFVIYSASGSWDDDYCLGRLSWTGGNPLDAGSWVKHPAPVFSRTDEVFGPGHGSFVSSRDGREDWIVYHAARHSHAGWDRTVRTQPFHWRPDGTPDFGSPIAAGVPIPVPGGDGEAPSKNEP